MKKSAQPQSGIIRVQHDNDHPYKTINTSFATDARLSWGARGVLVYLLSKPNDWKVMPKDLIAQSPAGRDAVYAILKDLEKFGYLRRVQTQRADGTFEWHTVVFESAQPVTEKPEVERSAPQSPKTQRKSAPLTEKPYTDEPYTEKPDAYLIRNGLIKERQSGGDTRARDAAAISQTEKDLMAAGGLNLKQARNAVNLQEFTVETIGRIKVWADKLRAAGKNPGAILCGYTDAGLLPDDLPMVKAQEWRPLRSDGSVDYDRWNALIAQDRRWRTGPVL